MKTFYTLITIALLSLNSFSQNSLNFDGINDFVNCGNNSSTQITGTAITLEAWIYPTSFKPLVWQGNIINKEANQIGYMLRAGGTGQLNFNIGTGSWNELNSPTNTLVLNTWQHVAATYDGSYMRIFVNGIIIDSIAKTASISNTTTDLIIGEGSFYTGRHFTGKIDEVRIWNSARTKAEIVANMNKEICVIPSSLKAYFNFNHGIASGSNSTVTTLPDFSGNANTGTLTNFALSGATSNWTTGQALTSGISNSSIAVTTCGSYTLPDGTIITTAGTYYDSLSTVAGCDSLVGYVINFSSAHISNSFTDSSCLTYTMPNGSLINTSGIYYDTLSGSGSCDTLDRYTITISAGVSDSVYQTGNKLTSFDTWAPSHQWINCSTGNSPIAGATSKTFTPTSTGNYALIVTRGSCIDTSNCFAITINNTGLNTINISNSFEAYPNPATDVITIKNKENQTIKTIKIIDITGKIVLTKTADENNSINVETLKPGIYLVQLRTNKGVATLKFIKQ